jgi:hypothetical protein
VIQSFSVAGLWAIHPHNDPLQPLALNNRPKRPAARLLALSKQVGSDRSARLGAPIQSLSKPRNLLTATCGWPHYPNDRLASCGDHAAL